LKKWRQAQREALGITSTREIPELSQDQVDELKRKQK
jgi:hypothetical protein